MRKNNCRNHESGMALILALLALLLISAVGLGMIYMSTTEASINTNYKDTQLAFFAMRGGLEEMRDRMRSNSVSPVAIPAAMPGAPNSILYIVNSSGANDPILPATFGNQYFDDEFCHESFVGSTVAYVASGIPCTAVGAPPAGSLAPFVASASPFTNTASSLKYKWVRITLKQNGTFPNALVDSTQPVASQVCWNSASAQEVVASALGYPDCTTAQNAGLMVAPSYLVTALAITPQGSRRVGQYESAALNITPPPGALALDGPAAVFNPAPSSSNYFANGNNSGAAAYNGPGGPAACPVTTPASTPAISTGDQQGVKNLVGPSPPNPPGSIPTNRQGNYTGTGPAPSVVNQGPTGTNALSGTWSSPSQLDALVNSLANVADVAYSCGIGTPCSPSGAVGTNANPQITYVSGDFNYGDASGAGVLVVTGTLSFTGNASFNGLVLVIGQGIVAESGGGNGGFNGTVFVAKTQSATSPYAELATLGSPLYSWNGGGNSDIQYNSCWAHIGNSLHYSVIAMREEMY